MCGLYGFLTIDGVTLNPSQRNARFQAVKKLAYLNEIRGRDSSGFAFKQQHSDDIATLKIVGDSHNLLADIRAKSAMRQARTNMLIGHTRMATIGAVTVPNAHPYIYGDIVGAHNGWLTNHVSLARTHNLEYQVDSQLIFQLLAKTNNDYTSVINEISGPAALTYTNIKTKHLYLLRHDNPLSVVWIPSLATYMWSSQVAHIDQAVGIFDDAQDVPLDNNEILRIKPSGEWLTKKITIKPKTYQSAGFDVNKTVYSSKTTDYDDWVRTFIENRGGLTCDWCEGKTKTLVETGYGLLCLACSKGL